MEWIQRIENKLCVIVDKVLHGMDPARRVQALCYCLQGASSNGSSA